MPSVCCSGIQVYGVCPQSLLTSLKPTIVTEVGGVMAYAVIVVTDKTINSAIKIRYFFMEIPLFRSYGINHIAVDVGGWDTVEDEDVNFALSVGSTVDL